MNPVSNAPYLVAVFSVTFTFCLGQFAEAGCPCTEGGGSFIAGAPLGGPPTMLGSPPMMASPPAIGPQFTPPVAPPPGTLGRTYRKRSQPVALDKHPRIAMLHVTGAGHLELKIEGVIPFKGRADDQGVWRFESDKPLIPGVSHIYKVKEVREDAYGQEVDGRVLFVRMIPGRIVYLEF